MEMMEGVRLRQGRRRAEREGHGTRSRGSGNAPSSYPTEGDEQVCVPLTVAQYPVETNEPKTVSLWREMKEPGGGCHAPSVPRVSSPVKLSELSAALRKYSGLMSGVEKDARARQTAAMKQMMVPGVAGAIVGEVGRRCWRSKVGRAVVDARR